MKTFYLVLQIVFSLLFVHCLVAQNLHIPPEQISFDHFGRKDGLTDNTTYSMLQDSKGFIWIGNYAGIDRFDGYQFKKYNYLSPDDKYIWGARALTETDVNGIKRIWIGTMTRGLVALDPVKEEASRYLHTPDSLQTLSSNYIKCIFKDSEDRLWIGTANGVNVLDLKNYPANQNFQRFLEPDSAGKFYILDIAEDSQKNIWLASYGRGLVRISGKFLNHDQLITTVYSNDKSGSNCLSSDLLTSVYIDRNDVLFATSVYGGLNLFYTRQKNFYSYRFNSADIHSICSNSLSGISVYNENEIWISSNGNGLSRISNPQIIQDGSTRPDLKFLNYNAENTNISSNYIWDIAHDRNGSLWVMTSGNGVNILNPYKNRFGLITHRYGALNSLSNNYVNCQFEDNNGILWIGTMGTLDRYDRVTKDFRHYKHISGDSQSLPPNQSIECLMPDPNDPNLLWLGLTGYEIGLCKFNKRTEKFTSYPISLSDRVYAMAPGDDGFFWLGLGWAKGIVRFNPRTGAWMDRNIGGKLPEQEIHQILNGRNGKVWFVPDGNGIYGYDSIDNELKHYLTRSDPDSEYWNTVNNIHQDKDGYIWLASVRGLARLDPGSESYDYFFTDDSINMYGILEDDQNHLWLSCDRGLISFNKKTKATRFYNESDGLQESIFNINPWRSKINGDFIFGGYGGINIFHPDSIQINERPPDLAITDFQLFNKSLRPGSPGSDLLKNSILYTEKIILNYDQNSFNFEFAALDMRAPQKHKYAYKLEGFDNDWIVSDASKRFASYTRLDPGDYSFKMKACNSDGIWNENAAMIQILVLPPWWRTFWAYIIYIIVLAGITITSWELQIRRINLKHKLQLEHLESEKYKEINASKSRFIANISHEFRTPITLIESALGEVFVGKLRRDYHNKLEIILRNSARLLNLVNRLLDLSKLEAGKMELRASKGNIVAILRLLTSSFESLAVNHNIDLQFKSESDFQDIYFDQEKIEEVINNLLGNAFKFTPSGGKITIECQTNAQNNEFIITCTNSGPGINPADLDRIFDRFYRVDNENFQDSQGVGIGLALVQELVKLHKGQISVSSSEGEYTQFTIRLPLGRDHLLDEEIVVRTDLPETKSQSVNEFRAIRKENSKIDPNIPVLPGKKILIIEDNSDMRHHLSGIFENDYFVIEAGDGQAGLTAAIKHMPDIIICDVMMPKMDGITMCSHIKKDSETSHIPVILLTARAEDFDRVTGLETGADDYITKPFSARELRIRVNNIFAQKERLRAKFLSEFDLDPADIVSSPADEKFLLNLNSLINKYMNSMDLTINSLAHEMNISRATLGRKIQALLGMNPAEYIRFLRLKRAHLLLKKGFGNVTEVSFEVGFNSVSYFSRCFAEQFGHSPSQLVR